MAVRPGGEKRKQRGVMATDSEWARVGREADAAGCSRSELLMRRCLDWQEPAASIDHGLPPSVLRRALQAVLILEELQRLRLVNEGETGETLWRRTVAGVDAWIDGEGDLG